MVAFDICNILMWYFERKFWFIDVTEAHIRSSMMNLDNKSSPKPEEVDQNHSREKSILGQVGDFLSVFLYRFSIPSFKHN